MKKVTSVALLVFFVCFFVFSIMVVQFYVRKKNLNNGADH